MTADPESRLQSICANAETITFTGLHPALSLSGSALHLYEFQPFEVDQPLIQEQEVTAVRQTRTEKGGSFTLVIPRFDGARDRLYSRFVVACQNPGSPPTGSRLQPLDGVSQVDHMEGIAAWDYEYPSSKTIKGLQVHMIEDALALGVGHAALNLNLPTILRPTAAEHTIPYRMDGREYFFDGDYMTRFDRRVKELSDHGIVVTLILLNSARWDSVEIHPELRSLLLHPGYNPEGFISAFNVTNAASLDAYKAFVEFVAQRYTHPDSPYGRACGFIIGNEVGSQWMWANAGDMDVQQYIREHSVALRTAFYAARKKYAQARVYLSLDHLWTISFQEDQPTRYYRGRDILEGLNTIYRREGNFDWSLAYHPYPEDLRYPNFWDDKTALESFDTPRITFKNIEILAQYLSQPQLLFDGRLRHIILSEQGFNSDETEEGERLQAAAYAYAYWKIERTPGIESFILHAHVDNRNEFGLNLGIRRRDKTSALANAPGSPKPIYEVFKHIDGSQREAILAQARQVVGPENWK